MKIILGLAMWMYASGISFLVGDIAFGSDINKYMEASSLTVTCVVGGLVIAALYSCWYLIREEQRVVDISVPVCVLFVWGLARRKILYAGGRAVVYSIAYELKKAYGVKTGAVNLDYVDVSAMYEFVVFVTAVVMFFAAYMIFRCGSVMIAIGLAFLFMTVGAMLDVDVRAAGVVLAVMSLMLSRYILMRNGRPVSPLWNMAVPLVVLSGCIVVALGVYGGAYERGIKYQGVLIEMVENIEYLLSGDSGNGYSTYYRIDGTEVKPSDDIVDEITRDNLPDGNLYVKARSYVVYDGGDWHNRDIGYTPDSEILIRYDSDTFARYRADLEALTKDEDKTFSDVTDRVTKYIRRHIAYTTSPGRFDADMDPVLYALYTGHKGYCIHYASAAALGLRSLGIPTKYNTGYVIPSAAWTQQEDGTYHAYILDKYSHAWVEAYDDVVEDWIVVDSTPLGDRADALDIPREPENTDSDGDERDKDTESTTEEITTEQTDDITTEGLSEENTDDTQEATENTEEATENTQESTEDTEKTTEAATKDTTADDQNAWSGSGDSDWGNGSDEGGLAGDDAESGVSKLVESKLFKRIVAAVCIIAAIMAAFAVRRKVVVSRRRRKLIGRDRITAVYEMSVAIWEMLTFAGLTEGVGSDDTEYAEIVGQRVTIIQVSEFQRFVACVQAAVYGQIQPDDEQIKLARRMYNKIRAYAYLGLGLKDRLVWRYIKCYDCGARRRKKQ